MGSGLDSKKGYDDEVREEGYGPVDPAERPPLEREGAVPAFSAGRLPATGGKPATATADGNALVRGSEYGRFQPLRAHTERRSAPGPPRGRVTDGRTGGKDVEGKD